MNDEMQKIQVVTMSDGQQIVGTIDNILTGFEVRTSDNSEPIKSDILEVTKDEYIEIRDQSITNDIPSDTIQAKAISTDMMQPDSDEGKEQ